jgi:hypothetical protein
MNVPVSSSSKFEQFLAKAGIPKSEIMAIATKIRMKALPRARLAFSVSLTHLSDGNGYHHRPGVGILL